MEKTPTRQEKKQAAVEKPDNASSPTPAKQAKKTKKVATTSSNEVEIDVAVLKEVETLNMVFQFKNLAARPDVKSNWSWYN